MDLQVASLKTVLESLKLETIRYLAGKRQAEIDGMDLVTHPSPDVCYSAATVFSCLAIALGVYRFWR